MQKQVKEPAPSGDDTLTTLQAGEVMGMNPKQFRMYAVYHQIPRFQQGERGKSHLYLRETILAEIQKRAQGGEENPNTEALPADEQPAEGVAGVQTAGTNARSERTAALRDAGALLVRLSENTDRLAGIYDKLATGASRLIVEIGRE